MKHLLLLCLTGMISATLSAQPVANPDIRIETARLQNAILAKQLDFAALSKTTVIKKRLTGYSLYQGSVLQDSNRHVYRSFMGSTHPIEASYYSNTDATEASFDAADPLSVQYIQSDTSISSYNSSTGLKQRSKRISAYDGGGNLVKEIYFNTINQVESHEHQITYNANGQRLMVLQRDTANGTPLMDKQKSHFIYDAQNRIILDSIEYMGIAGYRKHYSYNSSGTLSSYYDDYNPGSGWQLYSKLDFTYDASNRLKTTINYSRSGANWIPNFLDSLDYTGSAAQYTFREQKAWNATANAWQSTYGSFRYNYVLNGTGQIQTSYSLYNGGIKLDTQYRAQYFYNSAGLYDHIDVSNYTGQGNFGTPSKFQRFFYEDYSTTGISAVEKAAEKLTVYPNPSTGSFTVQTGSEMVSLHVSDLTGRIVHQQQIAGGKTVVMELSHLPKGSYVLIGINKARQLSSGRVIVLR